MDEMDIVQLFSTRGQKQSVLTDKMVQFLEPESGRKLLFLGQEIVEMVQQNLLAQILTKCFSFWTQKLTESYYFWAQK